MGPTEAIYITYITVEVSDIYFKNSDYKIFFTNPLYFCEKENFLSAKNADVMILD